MAISAYILKIVENDLFLMLQMRAKEMFNRHQIFVTLQLIKPFRNSKACDLRVTPFLMKH